MVSVQGGRLIAVPFAECIDPATGRGFRRDVDCSTQRYQVARKYMTRLEADDLENAEFLAKTGEAGADEAYLRNLLG